MDDLTRQSLKKAGWSFPERLWDCLSDYEKQFALLEFTGLRSLDYYKKRLSAIEFLNMDSVLDAACGMGQWSIALASLNRHVIGVDINEKRLLLGSAIAQIMERPNCSFRFGSIDTLSFASETFDAIFCYGALMFTDIKKTLSEFFRVLKPGGKVYLNVNSTGWYLHLLIDLGLKQKQFSHVATVGRTIVRTLCRGKSNIIVDRRWFEKQLALTGFKIMGIGLEGEVRFGSVTHRVQPAYTQIYYGFPSLIEAVVQKP